MTAIHSLYIGDVGDDRYPSEDDWDTDLSTSYVLKVVIEQIKANEPGEELVIIVRTGGQPCL